MNDRVRRRLQDVLFACGDSLCVRAGARTDEGVTRPWLFAIGNYVSELGWRLR